MDKLDQNDMTIERLLEIAAAIEQFTVKKPELVKLALISLHNIKEVLINHTDNPLVPPAQQLQLNLDPTPQVSLPTEEFNSNFQPFNDTLPANFNSHGTEVCFDELDSMQLAQVQNIPFLFHNNDIP
ncbi:hypothetical protein M9Y10_008350 [Tritrichomonas musculus]|uniref:Uncharacterized protein n=1 Tax=Tritrichomonas musculus TaxID=1915356 RepID=A0ABR2IY01_9EUKA